MLEILKSVTLTNQCGFRGTNVPPVGLRITLALGHRTPPSGAFDPFLGVRKTRASSEFAVPPASAHMFVSFGQTAAAFLDPLPFFDCCIALDTAWCGRIPASSSALSPTN